MKFPRNLLVVISSGFSLSIVESWTPSNRTPQSSTTIAAETGACSTADDVLPPQEMNVLPPVTSVTILKGGSTLQSLPAGYVTSFPHLVITRDGSDFKVSDIPTGGGGGFVNPHSFTDLWVPDAMDPPPAMRLALSALIKDGQLRCVLPGIDSFVTTAGGTAWRNWGLNSVPLASEWLDVGYVPLDQLRISAYARGPSPDGPGADIDPAAWKPLLEGLSVDQALGSLFSILSDPPPEIAAADSGFRLLTIPLPETSFESVENGGVVRVYLSEYPEPRKLLDLKSGEACGGGFLEVAVRVVASGKDSNYLPDAYRPLFAK